MASAVEFVVTAPANDQPIYLAAQPKVAATQMYGATSGAPAGAVLQMESGRAFCLLMHVSETNGAGTNIVMVAGFKPTFAPSLDSSGNLWRRLPNLSQPRYVQNRGTGIVYVSSTALSVATTNSPALLPGAAPDYIGGTMEFAEGEGLHGISVRLPSGGKVAYAEDVVPPKGR